jgi:hypothetical protein
MHLIVGRLDQNAAVADERHIEPSVRHADHAERRPRYLIARRRRPQPLSLKPHCEIAGDVADQRT